MNQSVTSAEIQALAASAQLEHRAMEQAINRIQAIIEFDLSGYILHANSLFLATMGYTSAEVVGQHHRMFCKPEITQSA